MSNSTDDTDAKSGYILGHSEREIARLKAQAAELDPITRRFLLEAGIVPGMRVLDVGSGAGDVAFLAAELVGATGEVVGVDLAPAAIEVAPLTRGRSFTGECGFSRRRPGRNVVRPAL
jgi:2-polyprenyl-3-methyl-5-hydroxy-6-metoxy-1,4-benzoquinol methylase